MPSSYNRFSQPCEYCHRCALLQPKVHIQLSEVAVKEWKTTHFDIANSLNSSIDEVHVAFMIRCQSPDGVVEKLVVEVIAWYIIRTSRIR